MKTILTQHLASNYLINGLNNWNGYIGNKAWGNNGTYNVTRQASRIINHFFTPIKALASKPVYNLTRDKLIITVFYFMPNKSRALNEASVNNLGNVLSKLFKQPVQLRLVKLQYPYLNRSILAQLVALMTRKFNFVRIQRMIFRKASIVKGTQSDKATSLPSHIVGIKIRISGRLTTERSRPRQTVQTFQIGSFSKTNKSLIDSTFYTDKNKKGAFTVKVWISQRRI